MSELTSLVWMLIVFLILREGFQQRDWKYPNASVNKWWHIYGWFMRLMIVGILYNSTKSWFQTIVAILLLWVVYNISCALGRKEKWYYLGSSGIDGIIRKVGVVIKNLIMRVVVKFKKK